MGSGGASSYVQPTTETITPAIARSVETDTAKAQQAQADARNRRSGISSTYNRFAAEGEAKNGTATKLGQ